MNDEVFITPGVEEKVRIRGNMHCRKVSKAGRPSSAEQLLGSLAGLGFIRGSVT